MSKATALARLQEAINNNKNIQSLPKAVIALEGCINIFNEEEYSKEFNVAPMTTSVALERLSKPLTWTTNPYYEEMVKAVSLAIKLIKTHDSVIEAALHIVCITYNCRKLWEESCLPTLVSMWETKELREPLELLIETKEWKEAHSRLESTFLSQLSVAACMLHWDVLDEYPAIRWPTKSYKNFTC